MRLTATSFLTLDGVAQAPGGPDEDRNGGSEHGGWLVPYADNDMGEIIKSWFAQADAFLLGRRTSWIFESHWPKVPDGNPVATALNGLPQYVVSPTLDSLTWRNSTLVSSDVVDVVTALKAHPGRELQADDSGKLIRTLIAHNLVDEYRLSIFPVVLGTGRRLFEGEELAAAMRLTELKATSKGVVVPTYVPAGELQHGSFATAPAPETHRILR